VAALQQEGQTDCTGASILHRRRWRERSPGGTRLENRATIKEKEALFISRRTGEVISAASAAGLHEPEKSPTLMMGLLRGMGMGSLLLPPHTRGGGDTIGSPYRLV